MQEALLRGNQDRFGKDELEHTANQGRSDEREHPAGPCDRGRRGALG